MTNTPAQYAEALLQAADGQPVDKFRGLVENCLRLVQSRGDWSKCSQIVLQLRQRVKERESTLSACVVTRESLKSEAVQTVKQWLQTNTGRQHIQLEQQIDSQILGGLILRYQDFELDATLNQTISQLIKILVK